jgi:hypothetical protein
MVWASVLNTSKLMIRDGYSRDKSTPIGDEELGGEMNLLAAYGLETENGRTVVMFRRAIQS